MNYNRDELLDLLAARYVIGTMRGAARHRFARIARELPGAQQALWRWERHLNLLVGDLQEVAPTKRVWETVETRLFAEDRQPRRWSLRLWRLFGLASALASVVLAIGLMSQMDRVVPTHVAQITDEGAQPLWVIGIDLEHGTMRARAINVAAADIDKAFELWVLPTSGQPRSLGLLPVGSDTRNIEIPPGLAALLSAHGGLAVSVEPSSGSPTGLPTGPVVHTASLSSL
jgi:anti-sigma-K factor RskA